MLHLFIFRRNLNTDFVCRRGVLATIMLTPYEEKEEWNLAVTFYNGTYYLQERREEEPSFSEEKKKMNYWGLKFEQYLTAGIPLFCFRRRRCNHFSRNSRQMESLPYSYKVHLMKLFQANAPTSNVCFRHLLIKYILCTLLFINKKFNNPEFSFFCNI